MPMFEFTCHECNKTFEELVFTNSEEMNVVCPVCHSTKVGKQLSAFAVGGSDSSKGATDFGGGCSTGSCCPGGSCGF